MTLALGCGSNSDGERVSVSASYAAGVAVPIEGAIVFYAFQGLNGEGDAGGEIDTEGERSVVELPAGTYRVTAYTRACDSAGCEESTLADPSGECEREVDVPLPPGQRIHLRLSAGKPCEVQLRNDGSPR